MSLDIEAIPLSALKILLALQNSGSLTEAARQCDVSQPAASKALARMEDLTGLSLIRRDQRPVRLTTEGRILADHARQRIDLDRMARQKLLDSKAKGAGLVRIASFGASASTHILPGLIKQAKILRPLMQVEISEGTDQSCLQSLQANSADFAISVDETLPHLDRILLAQDRLVALVPADSPMAQVCSLNAEALSQTDFILTKGGSEPLVREWFAKQGKSPNVTHKIQQVTSILAMVRAGSGISIIAEMAVPENHQGVAAIPLAPERPRNIYLVRKEGSFASRAADMFWTMVREKQDAS